MMTGTEELSWLSSFIKVTSSRIPDSGPEQALSDRAHQLPESPSACSSGMGPSGGWLSCAARSPGTDHSRLKPALSSVASHLPSAGQGRAARPGAEAGVEPRPSWPASPPGPPPGPSPWLRTVGQGLPLLPVVLQPVKHGQDLLGSGRTPGNGNRSQTTSLAAPGWGGLVVCVLEVGTGATG